MNGTSTANGNNSLSNELAVYYERVFLERAKATLVHQEGAQLRSLDGNSGKQVIFNRFSPLPLALTPLTEGVNPTGQDLVDTQVTVTLQEFGNSVKITRLLSTTDIDDRDEQKIEVIGQNMGESLDALVRNALYAGATTITAPSNGIMTASLVAQAVATLEENKALVYPGTFGYLGKIQPQTKYDLMTSGDWLSAAVYSNPDSMYQGEIGALFGVRFLVSNQGYSVAGTPTLFSNFIHGREAFGVYDNSIDAPKLYIVTGADSNNPAERFHVVSWAGQFARDRKSVV